jgi:hypothetical protein
MTLAENKIVLVAANRAGDQEAMRQLSQEREGLKKKNGGRIKARRANAVCLRAENRLNAAAAGICRVRRSGGNSQNLPTDHHGLVTAGRERIFAAAARSSRPRQKHAGNAHMADRNRNVEL